MQKEKLSRSKKNKVDCCSDHLGLLSGCAYLCMIRYQNSIDLSVSVYLIAKSSLFFTFHKKLVSQYFIRDVQLFSGTCNGMFQTNVKW